MSQRLSFLVDALFERPTLDRVDELLAALQASPRGERRTGLIDDLLDYRVVMADSVAHAEPLMPAQDSGVAA